MIQQEILKGLTLSVGNGGMSLTLEPKKKVWRIRFRHIAYYDYLTPLMYIPIEETRVEADTADEAWGNLVNNPYSGKSENYRKIEIEEA